MSILDDAIKEHLELKRQHGADASELKQLEDEAFGAAERPGGEGSPPDPLAEAPTQFMTQPDAEQAPEAPPAEGSSRPAPRAEIADLQEAPPVEEESPAMEHEAVPEPEPEISTGPTTEEREAIAEQPTEMYDIEEELSGSQAEAPSEEELLEEGIEEPRLAPVDPLAGLDEADAVVEVDVKEGAAENEAEEEYEEDDDFWDEKRLSDELDQALEAPVEDEDEDEGGPATQLYEDAAVENDQAGEEAEEPAPSHTEEDVLEETPDFLEETPEDDQLWFEQKPPKDFDFDD